LKAIRSGMDRPVRQYLSTVQDDEAFAKLFMRKGGEPSQWQAIYDGETDRLSPEQQCTAWLIFLETLADAPPVVACRFGAWYFGPADVDLPEAPEDLITPATAS